MPRDTDLALLAGRILLGGFFLFSSANHFLATPMLAREAAANGVPLPTLAVLATGVLLLVGGACVLMGYAPRIGLACLIVFLVGVTPIMHAFWTYQDPAMRMFQMANFTKNLAILGGCLAMLAIPTPWPIGLGRSVPRTRAIGRRARTSR